MKKFLLQCLGACAAGLLIAFLFLSVALTQPAVHQKMDGTVTAIVEANGQDVPILSDRAMEILSGRYEVVIVSF